MKHALLFSLFVYSLIHTLSASAQNYGTFVGLSVGQTRVNLEQPLENDRDSLGAVGSGVTIGHVFDSNIVTRLNVSAAFNFSLFGTFDRVDLSHLDASIGYQKKWDRFSLTPKIGFTRYYYKAEEGIFLNPGEEDRAEEDGSTFFWGLSAGYALSSRFTMALVHKNVNTDFGDYQLNHIDFLVNF